jgi:hypothetical protein
MFKFKNLYWVAVVATVFASSAAAQDPPSRVARLNYTDGNVTMQPAGLQDWTPAEINRPFTSGDSVYCDAGSRAEFHLDSAVIRAGEFTSFGFLTLNDQTIQLSLTSGDLYVNVRDGYATQSVEVDSPNASATLTRPGLYRFRITSNGTLTFVVVHQGEAAIAGGGQSFSLAEGNSAALSGSENLNFNINQAPPPDDFDLWAQSRDASEAQTASQQAYLPASVVGSEDMAGNGDWQQTGEYGPVWYPTAVPAGWAPYHYGHWAWIEPWGWTWVDDAPWGFAPFHYGRWVFIDGRWAWSPGPIIIVDHRPPIHRPVYAPALVVWFGGANVGWAPLGYGEVYTPSYSCSPRYFNNVNVANTTVVRTVNIANVYNTVYVNKTVYNQTYSNLQAPNAVSAMPQNAFASGRPVAQAAVAMRPQQLQMLQAAAVVAPPVAPTRQALMASQAGSVPVAKPPAQIVARQVVVQKTPAIAPAPFAVRQAYLQEHVGQPHDFATMHAQVAPSHPTSDLQAVGVRTPPQHVQGQPVAPPPAKVPAAAPKEHKDKPAEDSKKKS